MSAVDPQIIEFLNTHNVLTLATSFGDEPYCANLFYIYLLHENCLVVTSNKKTRHIRDIAHNIFVAGSIVDASSEQRSIRGVQFQGVISNPATPLAQKALDAYQTKFPFTVGMDTTLWVIDLTFLKYTDSSLEYGEKLTWKK